MNPEDNAARWRAVVLHAEGTGKYKNPYGTAFSGAQFDNSKPHPGTVYGSKTSKYRSAAHGFAQFMPDTWARIMGGNVPMTEKNQNIAFTRLAAARGVDIKTAPLTRENLAKLSPEWASLPTLAGKSYYGQPVKSYKELLSVFNGFKPRSFVERADAALNKKLPPGEGENLNWKPLKIPQIKKTEEKLNPLQILGKAVKHSLQILGNKH